MTIHELATCHRFKVVKAAVINNQWLGMVRQWQDMIYDGTARLDLQTPCGERGRDLSQLPQGGGNMA